jgi:hypothetical protein
MMTATPPATTERAYYCPKCGAFLCKSKAAHGVVRDVYCRGCGRRSDVYLGGVRAAGEDRCDTGEDERDA